MENSKRQRWRRVLGLKDATPGRDEKSAEVIDKQRVVRRPSRKRVRKALKRKDLNEKKAEMEVAREAPFEAPFEAQGQQGKQAGICDWHFEAQCKRTRGRIAHKYTACQLLSC